MNGSNGSGTEGTASINAISPRHGFLGRTVEVQISGDNTTFDAATTVDFGSGITVTSTKLVSATQLVCTLVIADEATPGDRDVTVHAGADTLVATSGYSVDPSLAVSIAGGPLVQGDIAIVTFTNLDSVPLGSVPQIIDIPGGFLVNTDSTDLEAEYEAFIDVSAAPGARRAVIPDGGFGNTRFVAADLAIGARTPTTLTLPSSASVVFDTHSKAFKVQTSTLGIVSAFVGNVGTGLTPATMLTTGDPEVTKDIGLAATGVATVTRATATTTNIVVGANRSIGNDADHTLQLDVIHTPVTAVTAESGTAHDRNAAQVLTSPAILDGTVTTASEEDAYAVSVPAGGRVEITVDVSGYATLWLITPQLSLPTLGFSGPRSYRFTNTTASAAQFKVGFAYESAAASYTVSFRTY